MVQARKVCQTAACRSAARTLASTPVGVFRVTQPSPHRSPYEALPKEAFWRTGVVGERPEAIGNLYRRKFPIERSTRIATAGSCFAQHISRHLRARQFSIIDLEPPPPGLGREVAKRFGYSLYSARYANIYTARQLLQLIREARGEFQPADPVWEKDARYYDAIRPSVEPEGLGTPDAVFDHRTYHLRMVRQVFESAELFVFTLGLTEVWEHARSGTVYPTAPATIAGNYDPAVHSFRNFGFRDVYDDMQAFFALAHDMNPKMRFLLTVSPVPLTATASGEHVLAATVYSKSVLRAVAGQLSQEMEDVDYFPSYEIVTSALSKGKYFEDNLRSIRAEGVDAAMIAFFAAHDEGGAPAGAVDAQAGESGTEADEAEDEAADAVCEEILLDAFSR